MTTNNPQTDPRVLARLREQFGVAREEVSDDDLLKLSAGSMTRASIQIGVDLGDCMDVTMTAVIEDWRKLRRLIVG